jgi:hypothetical protein
VTGGATIDRLVLELPGWDKGEARALAIGIGERLSAAGLDGEHWALSMTLDAAAGSTPERLAASIVETLLERIG